MQKYLLIIIVLLLACSSKKVERVSRNQHYKELREQMVERDIKKKGIINEEVLKAMKKVPRHEFVLEKDMEMAYMARELSIGYGKTIVEPYVAALIADMIEPKDYDKVLVAGSGTGYLPAIFAQLCSSIYTTEEVKTIAVAASLRFKKLSYYNIKIKHGYIQDGWDEHAPYNTIILTIASSDIAELLFERLTEGGRIIVPVADSDGIIKTISLIRKVNDQAVVEKIASTSFEPSSNRFR